MICILPFYLLIRNIVYFSERLTEMLQKMPLKSESETLIQVPFDDTGLYHKDAVFFSLNSFVGGLQSCNVLIIKKSLLRYKL